MNASEELAVALYPRLLGKARTRHRAVRDRAVEPEDIVQQAYLAFAQARPDFPDAAHAHAYLAAAVVTRGISAGRDKAGNRSDSLDRPVPPGEEADATVAFGDLLPDPGDPPDELAILHAEIRDLLADNQHDPRFALALGKALGRTDREMAAMTGLAEATIGTRLHRWRKEHRRQQ